MSDLIKRADHWLHYGDRYSLEAAITYDLVRDLRSEVARLREGLAEIAGPDTLVVTFVAGDGERALRVVTSQEYAQHILDEETDR